MSRSSDTRQRVREIAEALSAEGQPISSRKIREILGAGSLSTITDELAAWEQDKRGGGAPPPVRREGPQPPVSDTRLEPAELVALVDRMTTEISLLRSELTALRIANEEQLAKAYARYEAVQRHAMMQIDEARQTANDLRNKLAQVTREAELQVDVFRGKTQQLREENSAFRAKLEVYETLSEGRR